MKASIILFIAISAVLGDSATATPRSNWSSRCPQNPFLPELKNNNVSLFEVPDQYLGSSCGEEWKTYGLCCNETDLTNYSKQDHQNITQAVEALYLIFQNFTNTFAEIRTKAAKYANDDINMLETHQKELYRFIQGNLSIHFKDRLDQLVVKDGLHGNLTRCWSKIATGRSNAVCSMCSGRSHSFFSGNKILMADTDCIDILQECAPSFRAMISVLETLGQYLTSFQNYIEKFHYASNRDLSVLNKLLATIEREQVQAHIREYLKQENKEKMETAASLCSKLLNIEGPSFIEKVQLNLKSFKLDKIKCRFIKIWQDLKKNNQQNLNSSAQNNSTSIRLLFEQNSEPHFNETLHDFEAAFIESVNSPQMITIPDLETLFLGDVSVVAKNTDSSYTSYFGANGTTVSTHIHGIPFNITQAFP